MADEWSKSYVKVKITYTPRAITLPTPLTIADLKGRVGHDQIAVLKIGSYHIFNDAPCQTVSCPGKDPITSCPSDRDILGFTDVFGIVNGGRISISIHSPDITIDSRNPQISVLSQSDYSKMLQSTVAHEIGHALGLAHIASPNSIMYAPPQCNVFPSFSIDTMPLLPSSEDIEAVNGLYLHCGPSPAQISLSLAPNPAPLVNGVCAGYTDSSHWQIETTIKEVGGSTGATLNSLDVSYYLSQNAQGTSLSTQTFPFTNFLGGKGFSKNTINPSETLAATLCQVPWKPEQLSSIKMTVKGTDDKGNAVQAANTINF